MTTMSSEVSTPVVAVRRDVTPPVTAVRSDVTPPVMAVRSDMAPPVMTEWLVRLSFLIRKGFVKTEFGERPKRCQVALSVSLKPSLGF